MTRSRSTSQTRRPKGPGLGYGWDSRRGWQLTFFVLGRTIASLAITPGMAAAAAATAIAAASAAALGAAAIGPTVWATAFVSKTLWDWATTSGENSKTISSELIVQEKATAGLSSGTAHVAICGPAGSGKSSVINSLRGLRNNHPEAARVGTVETTTVGLEVQFDRGIQSTTQGPIRGPI
ncbi:hypothetical protein CCUS01_09893 [Colletotrichum cuscutae]|uniref:IRG-type G domain-containing protein n=1 Tax=Colletotrichum cuscutae TaxID=1209917 RepID=A0AAI9UGQ7_9PEZI|nr:hypothetical protein CCUS01_09893 [Colletotrichum cuscutae]